MRLHQLCKLDSSTEVDSDGEQIVSETTQHLPTQRKAGRNGPLFSDAEQQHMVAWLQQCAAQGMVITRENFLEDLLRIAQMEQRGNRSHREVEPFVVAFQSRFTRELRIGSNSSVLPSTGARRVLAPAAWYRSVSGALQRLYPGVSFADPRRVLFLGELNVWLDEASASVRGLRSPAAAAATCAADNVAHVLTVSAAGERGPAMLVTPSSGLVRDDLDSAESCFRQATRNGNLTPAALLMYVAKALDPHLMARQVARPVLLYVDGLHHHASVTLSEFCQDRGVVLVGLPPAGQARNPAVTAFAGRLAADLGRLAEAVRRGRRAGPRRAVTTSLRALRAGIAEATAPACQETIAQAVTSSGLYPWAETVVEACERAEEPSVTLEVTLEPASSPPPPFDPPSVQEVGVAVPPAGLTMEEIIQVLLDETKHYKALASVPVGRKEDVGYLVSDEPNMERRVRGQRSRFQDDVGKWRYSLSPKLTYVMDEWGVRRVMKSDPDVYCVRSQVDGTQVWLPMTPQPSDESTIVELQRNYSTLARDSSYKRKVTWINACYPGPVLTPAVAWYEYMGCWPDDSGRGNGPTTEQPSAGKPRVPTGTVPAEDDPGEAPLESVEVSSESALSDVAEVGIPIPPTGLRMDEVFKLLLGESESLQVLDAVPRDKGVNVAYLISNESNVERRKNGQKSRFFVEEDTAWKCGSSPKTLYLMDAEGLRSVSKNKDGMYCVKRKLAGRIQETPLDPQPADDSQIFELQRNYSTLVGDVMHTRKVTWINSPSVPAVALYEFMERNPDDSVNLRTWAKSEPRFSALFPRAETVPVEMASDLSESMEVPDEDIVLAQPESSSSPAKDLGFPISPFGLDTAEVVRILLDDTKPCQILEAVPRGKKENVAYLVSNQHNVKRRTSGHKSLFWDDAGAWTNASSPKTLYVMHEDGLQTVIRNRAGLLCLKKRVKGKILWKPLNPQPSEESVVEVQRNYGALACDTSYKRRVTWINMCRADPASAPAVALFEYTGSWPGFFRHGNSRGKSGPYVRTKPAVVARSAALTLESSAAELHRLSRASGD